MRRVVRVQVLRERSQSLKQIEFLKRAFWNKQAEIKAKKKITGQMKAIYKAR